MRILDSNFFFFIISSSLYHHQELLFIESMNSRVFRFYSWKVNLRSMSCQMRNLLNLQLHLAQGTEIPNSFFMIQDSSILMTCKGVLLFKTFPENVF